MADGVSGNLVGTWLLIPELLRLGAWDLLLGWTGQPAMRVEPRIALQLVYEAALCSPSSLRAKGALGQKGLELACGLHFIASDPAVHYLLDEHTYAEAVALQVGLGQRRRDRGHFPGPTLLIDPHRITSYTKRQERLRKDHHGGRAIKTVQTFFCVDALTSQPLCCTLTSSAPSVSQATPELLRMAAEILNPDPGQFLAVADAEHFTVDLVEHVAQGTPFDMLVPAPNQRRITRLVNDIDDTCFQPAWPGYATTKVPFHFAEGHQAPYSLFVQRTGERPCDYERKAFLCTAERDELPAMARHYPDRWHIEEFFNRDQAIGWNRARTMNMNIRYGLLSMSLIAQAAMYQMRQRLGTPFDQWDAKHLSHGLLHALNGDIGVQSDTIVVTFYNAPHTDRLRTEFQGLPTKLGEEGVDPHIPWLYDFKLDFRFK